MENTIDSEEVVAAAKAKSTAKLGALLKPIAKRFSAASEPAGLPKKACQPFPLSKQKPSLPWRPGGSVKPVST